MYCVEVMFCGVKLFFILFCFCCCYVEDLYDVCFDGGLGGFLLFGDYVGD